MKIATVTIDRGDRPKMIKHCKYLINQQTRKPDAKIFVINPSVSSQIDIVPRFRSAWLKAKQLEMDYIVVMESDDWYFSGYLAMVEIPLKSHDYAAIGQSKSLYYNICNKTYQWFTHDGRASLYTTAFKVSCLDNFIWPKDDYKFLDMPLWDHLKKFSFMLYDPIDNTVGIKHKEGIRAGVGHKVRLQVPDPQFKYLESIVGEVEVEYYKKFCI